jgi:hypothetical protein
MNLLSHYGQFSALDKFLLSTVKSIGIQVIKAGAHMLLKYYEKSITSVNSGKEEFSSAHWKSIRLTRVDRTER